MGAASDDSHDQRSDEASDAGYGKRSCAEQVDERYTRGAAAPALDSRDIDDDDFPSRQAAAYYHMDKYVECVKDCDEALEIAKELKDGQLVAKALYCRQSALILLADCSRDCARQIQALQLPLDLDDPDSKLEKEDRLMEQKQQQEELADDHRSRKRGDGFMKKEKPQHAVPRHTKAIRETSHDPRGEFHSSNHRLKKIMEEVEAIKKEAFDKRRMRFLYKLSAAKKTKEALSRTQQELEQIKIQNEEFTQELQKANEHIKQLEEFCNRLQTENDRVVLARDGAVREAKELRRTIHQMCEVTTMAMHCEFSSHELQCATENFSSSLKIGEGGFGSVYRGFLRSTPVAIKVLKSGNLQGQSQFEQEVTILSKVRHPHLVILIGACSETSTLVYEFLPNGSLEDFLECAEKRRALSWQIRVRIIAETSSALVFLHQNKPPIVHSDLKPANVLLDANLVSKLGDFGISRFLMESSTNGTAFYVTMQPTGTLLYMDPEFLATGKLTAKSDTYSFGILVLRLLTGRPPAEIRKLVKDAMENGELMSSLVDASAGEWPSTLAHRLAKLGVKCTRQDRRRRPDLSDVVRKVRESMKSYVVLG